MIQKIGNGHRIAQIAQQHHRRNALAAGGRLPRLVQVGNIDLFIRGSFCQILSAGCAALAAYFFAVRRLNTRISAITSATPMVRGIHGVFRIAARM